MHDIIIVGAGASGLMAGATASADSADVLILEKNSRPARKVMITGKGRCNVTNNCTVDEFIKAQTSNPRFLYSAVSALPPSDLMSLIEKLGVPLKTERGKRVFPQSDRAVDIVDALVKHATQNGASIVSDSVTDISHTEGGFDVTTVSGQHYTAKAVIIATGGKSYPLTGSVGDGYTFAQKLGHTIIPPTPSLIPIVTKEGWCAHLTGLSLRNVTLTLKKGKKVLYSEIGEMLFTHFGVSGPLVLSASAHMKGDITDYSLFIDLKPGLTPEMLDARLLRDFEQFKNKTVANSLVELLPSSLIPVLLNYAEIPDRTQVNSVTKQMRQMLCTHLKALPLTPFAFRPIDEAIVTAGGVKTSEISPKTMMSKVKDGLFFGGEVIDIDAYTGGFNLHNAFCTGFLAGKSAVEYIRSMQS